MPRLLVATVTPFTDGRVDLDQARAHARWLIAQGAQGLAPVGTTGEFLYLDLAEKLALQRTILQAADGAVPVLPCVWDPTPAGRVRLAQEAEAHGAWGIFAPPPLYHTVSTDAIRRWYAALRQATALPVLAYHHPNTHNPLSPELVARLVAEEGLWGLKDSSRDRARIRTLTTLLPERVHVGGDDLLGQAADLGPVAGHISGYANAWPAHARALIGGTAAREDLLARLAAIKAAGGTAAALKARLGMGHRAPLDGVSLAEVLGLPPPEAGWAAGGR